MSDERIPRIALALGLGGLLPFVVCAGAMIADVSISLLGDPARAMLNYGAVILSFLGGVRWGYALRMTDAGFQARAFVLAVAPSITAWLLLLPPTLMGLILLPILFLLLGLADEQLAKVGVPPWYVTLRRLLTGGAILALMAGIYGLAA